MAPYTPASLSIRILRTIILAGLLVALWGCQTTRQDIQEDKIGATDTELLYNVIVALIAAQRDQPETALEYLSRAAWQWPERRLVAESIKIAMANQEYQQAVNLAQLLDTLEPDDYLITLSVAKAKFRLGEIESGLDLLADLIRKCNQNHGYIFQAIATLLTSEENVALFAQFRRLVESRSDDPALQMTAAFVASKQNQPDRYVEQLNKVLALEPDWEFPAILILMQLSFGSSDDAAGENENAADRYASKYAIEHLEAHPEQIKFRLQFARHLIQNGDLDSALDQLNITLDKNPDSLDALYAAGVVYFEKDDLDNSRDLFVRCLKLDPGNSQARIYLSDIEYRQGNYVAASNYLYGVTSQQFYLDAQIRLAVIVAKRYEVESGVRHLQQIDVVSDEDRIHLILQQDLLLREYDRYDRSKQVLDRGLKRFPDHPDLLYNRGLVTAKLDLLELHEQDMRKLIEIEPDNAHAYNAYGYTLADKTDRLEEAMALIKKANALLPDNPFILDSLGWVHYRLGNNSKAIDYLLLALGARQDAEIAAHLGEVLWVTGNREEARKIWDKGTEWEPENGVLKQTIERLSH